jgi:hypothetical protein
MMNIRIPISIAAAMTAAAFLPAQAQAMGCNGIVNPQIAGCTRVDNNDGASFPYFKLQRVSVPANAVRIEMVQGTPMVRYGGKLLPVLKAAGNMIVAAGGA